MKKNNAKNPTMSDQASKRERKDSIPSERALLIAADPTAPVEILTALAEHEDDQVGSFLATNPNTPESVLHRLWLRFPLAILQNPILSYRSFTTGESFTKLLPSSNKLALYSALRKEEQFEEIETWFPEKERSDWFRPYWERGEVERTIASDQLHEIDCHLATDPSALVRRTMLTRVGGSALHLYAKDREVEIRLALTRLLPTTAYLDKHESHLVPIADTLSTDAAEEVRAGVAACKSLSAEAHTRLAKDASPLVREKLAANGGCVDPEETGWRELLKDGDKSCELVAKNVACPDSVRLDLTSHAASGVRVEAWKKLNFSKCQLTEKLAQKIDNLFADPVMSTEREEVAANRSITPTVIERVIHCGPDITRVLAANNALSPSHLSVLLQMDDEQTASIAMKHSTTNDLLRQGLAHPSPKVRVVLAGLPLPYMQDLRYKLAVDPALEVREAVFDYIKNHVKDHRGRKISEILTVLSHDPGVKFRARIIEDYRLPSEEVDRMGKDKSVRVRLNVLRRRSWRLTTDYGLLDEKRVLVRCKAAEIIARSLDFSPFKEMNDRVLNRLESKIAADPSPEVRVILAGAYDASAKILRKLIKDPSPEVQRELTERYLPRTPGDTAKWSEKKTGVLKDLEAHRNPYIRAIAATSNVIGKFRTRRMATDRCWYVRAMLAKNIKDSTILETLSKDKHPLVCEYANEKLERFKSDEEHDNSTPS
ncbi:MAG: hypothetical protein ACK49I_02855 [Verrucomicrobiota bacterium]